MLTLLVQPVFDHFNPIKSYTKVMFRLRRLNLKLKKYAMVILSLLFVIFLIHPGRFSVIEYEIVAPDKIQLALLQYSTNFSDSEKYFCQAGGFCSPVTSPSLPMVTIVVPYRNREEQLEIFLSHMHRFLQRQGLSYVIIVVEQLSESNFNRAKLFNIGFKEMMTRFPGSDCFIFHDVDLLPVSEENAYICLDRPRHMITSLNEFRYNLPYSEMTGGALAISADQFKRVNGFSNAFFGWGGEDDEFYQRLAQHDFQPVRYHPSLARYVSLKHLKQSHRSNVNVKTAVFANDGLNSLNYSIHSLQYLPQFTLIQVYL